VADRTLLASLMQHPSRRALLLLDATGRTQLQNSAAEELCGPALMQRLHPQLEAARGRLAAHPDETIELQLDGADGAVTGQLRAARQADGVLAGYTLSLWRRSDTALADAVLDSTRSDFALQNAEDGLWDWSAATGRVYRSPRLLQMLGYAPGELDDSLEAWQALVHPEDRARQAAAIGAHVRGEIGSYQCEYRVRHRQGHWLWLLDRGKSVFRGPDGEPRRTIGIHTDITAYKTLEARLRAREQLLNQAQRQARLGSWIWDVDGGRVRWSNELYRIMGWTEGTPAPSYEQQRELFGASFARLDRAMRQALADGAPFELELEVRRLDDQEPRVVLARGEAVRDEQGRIFRLAGVVQDVTEQRLEHEARRRERQLLDRVSALGNIGGFELMPDSGKVFLTEQAYRILHLPLGTELDASSIVALYAPESQPVVREAVRHAVSSGGPFDLELQLVQAGGDQVWIRTRGEAEMFAGRCVRLFGTLQDITERRQAEQRIAQLAHYDTLTGLPNRVLFADRARVAVARALRNRIPLALMFVDLDNFKNVNDSLGHAAGDLLLQEVTRRFVTCIRASDTVSRQGGDEFLVLLPEIRRPEDAGVIAQKLIDALAEPIALPGMDAAVGCSIGIALLGPQCADLDALLRNADTAMYDAKAAGRRRYRFFSEDLQQRAHQRLTLENELREALALQRFRLHYQPQIDIESGRVVGLEALLRLELASGETRSAAEFIGTAEDSGLILPLGEWVHVDRLRAAARLARARLGIAAGWAQRVVGAAAPGRLLPAAAAGLRAPRPATRGARDRAARSGADGRSGFRPGRARASRGARRVGGGRQLRHRLLQPGAAAPLPAQPAEDRQGVRDDARQRRRARPARRCDRLARPHPRHAGDRRGRGVGRGAGAAAGAGLRRGAGALRQPAAGGRGDPRLAGQSNLNDFPVAAVECERSRGFGGRRVVSLTSSRCRNFDELAVGSRRRG
jgi:diguanylate cyclase (GGDEF)-like protein/PAS domain S-box-containing protein